MSTSLSTVGLGDIHPISDNERLAMIPYFLFGIIFFSLLNVKTLEMITEFIDRMNTSSYHVAQLNMFL